MKKDYDAHAKRMTIIRTSSRYKEFEKAAEVSDWYKDKIISFKDLENCGIELPPVIEDKATNTIYVMTAWGYVREDLIKNGDACRGLVPLAIASDNVSKMTFRNWRHVYDLRRPFTHAAPELQIAVEEVRDDLTIVMPPLGDNLGKVWVPKVGFVEKPDTVLTLKEK